MNHRNNEHNNYFLASLFIEIVAQTICQNQLHLRLEFFASFDSIFLLDSPRNFVCTSIFKLRTVASSVRQFFSVDFYQFGKKIEATFSNRWNKYRCVVIRDRIYLFLLPSVLYFWIRLPFPWLFSTVPLSVRCSFYFVVHISIFGWHSKWYVTFSCLHGYWKLLRMIKKDTNIKREGEEEREEERKMYDYVWRSQPQSPRNKQLHK